jgi:mannose/fructose/N-acetylgalactosamine-specific phosphotransferase system component IIB
MAIILARIDDRFIHGQVTVGWSQKLRPTRIVLSNDEIAADQWQSRVYSSSVPPRIAVAVLSGADTLATLAPPQTPEPRDRTILIAGSPGDMHFLCTHGLPLAEINVGGMHYTKGKTELLPFVYADRTDLDVFRSLLAKGVRLLARQVPGARETEIDLAMIAAAEECL